MPSSASTTVRALFDCVGDDEEELSFKRGDIIVQCLPAQDEGWLIGTCQSTGARGLFPSNYTEPIVLSAAALSPPSPPKSRSTSVSSNASTGSASSATSSARPAFGTGSLPRGATVPDSFGASLSNSNGSSDTSANTQPKVPIAELAAKFSNASVTMPALRTPSTSSGATSSSIKSRASAFEVSSSTTEPAVKSKPSPSLPPKPDSKSPFATAEPAKKAPPPAPVPKPASLAAKPASPEVSAVATTLAATSDEEGPKKPPSLPSRSSVASTTGSAFAPAPARPALPSRTNTADSTTNSLPRPGLPSRTSVAAEPAPKEPTLPRPNLPVRPDKPDRPSLPSRTNSVSSLPRTGKPEMAEKREAPLPLPPRDAVPVSSSPIPSDAESRYLTLFRTLSDPATKLVAGIDVKQIWLKSGLDTDTLASIWELADGDDDGQLALGEFLVGMQLVEDARNGKTVPDKLGREMLAVRARR